MSAFNTATNTGSTTFTNAWGTVELLPSAGVQKVSGFVRTSGWRYFEMAIDDNGGDNSRLFVGVGSSPVNTGDPDYLIGGASKRAIVVGSTFAPAYPYSASTYSLTVCTGDVFMFAVDMSGAGRLHDGSQPVSTLSSGGGELLTKCITEVGKNGVWQGTANVGWAWPSHGFPMHVVPWVARDSTSGSAAKVSLRVVTASFAYTIPTGMIAWDDGPEGGASLSADATVYWDVTTADSDITLSASNFLAMSKAAGTSFSSHSIKTTALVTTGKRVIEFWGSSYFAYATSLSAQTTDDLAFNIGICDADMASISWSPVATSTKIIWGDDKRRRGVSKATSMTNVQTVGQAPQQNGSIFYLDFDTERLWQRRGLASGNALSSLWAGRTISAASGPDPYIGNDGMTFSVSTPGVRMIAWARKDFAGGNWVYVNAGQTAFQTFPLLPGWKSMDGSRQVAGGSTYWDTSVMPASLSVCYTGLAVRHVRGTADNPIARSNNTRSSGKYFFEIFDDAGNGGASLSTVVGLIPTTVGTFTAANIVSIAAVGLWWSPGNRERVRYGTSLSYSNSVTWSSVAVVGSTNAWWACAVDFDAGQIWFGHWNWNRQAIAWAVGADPATGTQPDMTFTAGTAMHIASTVGAGWRYLVTESANVIGIPSGFTPWDGNSTPVSATATPSGTTGGGRVLWPYGVMT